MIIEIVMPKMGESITEGTILEWRKKVGEFVEKDELFLEIGTDKVDSEIPCVESGTIIEILAEANEVVEVGKTIAKIDTGDSSEGKKNTPDPIDLEKGSNKEPQEKEQIEIESSASQKKDLSSKSIPQSSNNFITRAVMKVAREKKYFNR